MIPLCDKSLALVRQSEMELKEAQEKADSLQKQLNEQIEMLKKQHNEQIKMLKEPIESILKVRRTIF